MGLEGTNLSVAILALIAIGTLGSVLWLTRRSLNRSQITERASRDALVNTRHELSMALRSAQECEARYQAVVNTALDAIVSADDTEAIVDLNPAAEKMFGYRKADLLHQPLAKIIVWPGLVDTPGRALAHYFESDRAAAVGQIVELTALRADGSEFPVELAISRATGQGRPQFTAYIRDITERKHGLERFRLAIEAAPTGMIMVDDAGRIVMVNALVEELFGYDRAALAGQPIETLIPPRFRTGHPVLRAGFFSDPHARPMGAGRDLYGLRRDGTEVPIEIGLNPIDTAEGRFVLSSIVDITERKRASEQFRVALEAAPTGMIMVDGAGRIVLVNRLVEKLFGHGRTDLVGQSIEILIPQRFRAGHPALRNAFFGDPRARPMGEGRDLYGLRRDGTEMPIEIGLNPIETADGRFVLSSIVDVTARKRADGERARLFSELQTLTKDLERRVEAGTRDVRANEARYRALFDESPIALWEEDFTETIDYLRELQSSIPGDVSDYLSGHPEAVATALERVKVLAVNRRSLELFQAATTRDLLEALPQTFGPGARDVFRDKLVCFLEGRSSFEAETVRLTLTGRSMDISLRSSVLGGHGAWSRVVDSMVDVTATREAERKLTESFHQQEVLLKEIHHRVKNNLAVISSLFYLESRYSKDEATIAVFEESQHRVRSMALVHEKLYGSASLAAIDFGEYARELATELVTTYRTQSSIRLETDVHTVKLGIDLAVPCGLILNELISNALKHAFSGGGAGVIALTVRADERGMCHLYVSDDGVGLPPDVNAERGGSLGLRLIRSLARQIRASVDFVSVGRGTEARVTFALEDKPD